MVVQPEAMTLGTGSDGRHNTVDGVVTNVRFQGSYRRISVQFGDGSTGLVREPAVSQTPVRVGERVPVTWSPASAVVV